MERTISGMMGKGSVNHNTRAFTAKNVDKERSRDNVEFCHSDIKEVYHILFDKALERYNAKQKRSDRKIDDYYEKIRRGKQEKLFYEVIFQIGNKDDMNVQ
ncbi:MAG: recombinase, partial [Roseburia sp.]|nr:recombinase [Roseburia sp.]